MWIFKKNEKSWSCPDASLVTIARIQATDRDDDFKDFIVNNDMAKNYLKRLGFEIEHIADDEPLEKIPTYYEANWYNRQHRDLYDKLFYQKMNRPLTEAENEFCKAMYHAEEFACGLDGDR